MIYLWLSCLLTLPNSLIDWLINLHFELAATLGLQSFKITKEGNLLSVNNQLFWSFYNFSYSFCFFINVTTDLISSLSICFTYVFREQFAVVLVLHKFHGLSTKISPLLNFLMEFLSLLTFDHGSSYILFWILHS